MNARLLPLDRKLSPDERRKLRAIWEAVPPVPGCKGLCYDSCTNVPLQPLEAYYLVEEKNALIEIGVHPADDPANENAMPFPTLGVNKPCQFLDANRRCSIYEDRPLICRLFGHPALTLHCVHGCGEGSSIEDLECSRLMILMTAAFEGFEVREGEDLWLAMTRTVGEMEIEAEEAEI